MILFRADANSAICTGHVMRCLSLADAFWEAGWRVIFATAEPCAEEMIRRRGYGCVVLHTAYDRMEDELPVFLPLLRKLRPRCILLDSYFVTPDYMSALRQEAPLVYIDDLNTFNYPADLVINYTLYAEQCEYPQDKRYLLGPEYVPLRREFQNIPQRMPFRQVKNVLISAGGADPAHVALACAAYLREQNGEDGRTYHMVLGSMNPDMTAIQAAAAGCPYLVLHRQVSDMRTLMLNCDAAVSAAGSTLFELCACGLPAVTYVLADNQIRNAASFAEAGVMLHGGDVRTDPAFAGTLFTKLELLAEDTALRQRMSQRMQDLVDGNGAARCVGAIENWIGAEE